MSVVLLACLSVCLIMSACLSVCRADRLSDCLSVCLPACLSVCLSAEIFVVCMSGFRSFCACVVLSCWGYGVPPCARMAEPVLHGRTDWSTVEPVHSGGSTVEGVEATRHGYITSPSLQQVWPLGTFVIRYITRYHKPQPPASLASGHLWARL